MNRSNPVPPGAFAHACSFVRHAVSNALAAAALLSPGIGGAAPTCADVLKSIENRFADAGVRHPPLKIVPKGLASGYRVVGTCEDADLAFVFALPASFCEGGGSMSWTMRCVPPSHVPTTR